MAELTNNIPTNTFDPSVPPKVDDSVDNQIGEMSEQIKSSYVDPNSFAREQLSKQMASASLFGRDNKVSFTNYDIDVADAYTRLNSGKLIGRFENYLPNTNNEQRLALQQSTSEKWTNGISKFLGKTLTAVAGGTIGIVDGVVNGISEGSLSAVYDSDFNKWLDDLNTKMDYNLPNYYTEQEKSKGFLSSMGTANFWANDVMGALSFTTGAIVSEGIWAAGTGGTSLLAKGALSAAGKLGVKKAALNAAKKDVKGMLASTAKKGFKDYQKSAIVSGRVIEGLNTTRFMMTSAGYEAGVEARHYLKETQDEWLRNFEQSNGRKPTTEEIANFRRDTLNSANTVFFLNTALVGASNYATLGRLALGRPVKTTLENNNIKKALFGVGFEKTAEGAYKEVTAKGFQKVFGSLYGIGKPALTEGVFEEGGQSIISSTAKNYMLNSYDEDATKNSYSIADALRESIVHTYGTKEGFKEVGIGMIVGLLGGGATSLYSGQGLFNEIGSEREKVKSYVDNRNKFRNDLTVNIIVNRLRANNKIQKAAEKVEDAQRRGDVTAESMSDQELMIATIDRDIDFQGAEQGISDFEAGLATISNKDIADSVEGLEEADVEVWKQEKINEYKELSERHARNREFAKAILGSTNIKEIANDKREDVERAIAYNLSMGEQSNELANTYVQAIIDTVGADLVDTDAIPVQHALSKLEPKVRGRLGGLTTQKKKLQEQYRKVEKQITTFQNAEDRVNQLKLLNDKLVEIAEKIEFTDEQRRLLLKTSEIQGEAITVEQLDAQQDSLNSLKETIESLKYRDPKKYANVGRLFREYEKANTYAKTYDATTRRLTDPNLAVTEINGWLSGLLSKFKTPNATAEEFFANIAEEYDKTTGRVKTEYNTDLNQFTQTPPEETEDGLDPPTKTEGETSQPETKTTIEKLQEKINNIINGKYSSIYNGNDSQELIKNQPSKKDADRFAELLDKIPANQIDTVTYEPYNKDSNLTEEEFVEFIELNTKLNDWKTLEGTVLEDSNSLSDLVKLLAKKQEAFEKAETKTELSEQDFIEIAKAPETRTEKTAGESLSTIINPNQVVVGETKEGNYRFSHLDLNSLVRLIPNSVLYKVNKEGVEKLDDGENWKDKGNIYLLKTSGGNLKVEIGDRARLIINKESFDQIGSSIKLLTFRNGKSTYYSAYVKVEGQDKPVPLEGDFSYASIIENEQIDFDPNKVYDLKQGQILRTEVNKNDVYNAQLLEEYESSKKTKKDKEKLIRGLNIFLTVQGATRDIVGSMRAIEENTKVTNSETLTKLYNFRKEAVEKILKSKEAKVDLGRTIPVKFTLIGNPNISVREEGGQLVPDNMEFTDEMLSQIVDVGYVQNDEIKTQKGLQLERNQTIFARSLRDKQTKTPIIVFKYRGITQVFPIALKTTTIDKSDDVREVMGMNIPSSQKIMMIEEILRENNLDPKEYDLDPYYEAETENGEIVGWQNSEAMGKVFQDMSQIQDFANVEDWLDSGFNIARLKDEALTPLDISDRPFAAGKTIIDLENAKYTGETEALEETQEIVQTDRISFEKKLSDLVVEVDRDWRTNPAYENIQGEFADVMDENEVFKRPQDHLQVLSNIRIIREAFSKKIPNAVSNSIGSEKIEEIKSMLKSLDTFKKTITEIKNTKLKNQIKNEEVCRP